MSEAQNGQEHVAQLIAAMEKHVAFLEGALGIEMSLAFKQDDITLSEIGGVDINIACRLVFPSRASESGWMEDSLLFNTLEECVTFLDHVELLVRIARAQQRGE